MMQENRLPMPLRDRIRQYFRQTFSCHDSPVRLNSILESLSPSMKREVLLFIHGPWIKETSYFSSCSERLQGEMGLHLTLNIYAAGEEFGEVMVLVIVHH